MREVQFNRDETVELAMFVITLTKEGANYNVRKTNDGWCVLVRGV